MWRRREEGRTSPSIISTFVAWRLVARSRSSRAVACTGAAVHASTVVPSGARLHTVAAVYTCTPAA
eukprot:8099814-Pyramimonas_sp.AAC.1